MTLQTSGPIGIDDINIELGNPAGTLLNLDSPACRDLAGIPSGTIGLSDFYGASAIPDETFHEAWFNFEGDSNFNQVVLPVDNALGWSFSFGPSRLYASTAEQSRLDLSENYVKMVFRTSEPSAGSRETDCTVEDQLGNTSIATLDLLDTPSDPAVGPFRVYSIFADATPLTGQIRRIQMFQPFFIHEVVLVAVEMSATN